MKLLIKKIAKPLAIGVFFMALFFNVKVSLEDPFIKIDNAVLAQSSSSSGGTGQIECWDTITYQEGVQTLYCGSCSYASNSKPSFWSGKSKCAG
ncbi:MAG: hypothetical protein Q8S14_20695 [Algoriphagus sp.]|jgi:hypothetical protein|uniref:hypothetical protein n=1 Tax=Algoriphagus sp. TaxID=1872435 RepID=UPI00271CFCC8|nr:hypothetical protein [Algoriphagus sp.]MDO8967024.1 hypothetical protein [Algoriphagus sp.]MDP2043225.1 hypothetical protein [Algoriphagus sp.]MDP3199482.1 hypothetical protein [Algoriphagus sp.]MDP3474298.1 hypothetical protein [Algoriphagus sp.]